MKAAVTGGTGFLGRALVEALVCDGHEVVATARRDDAELARLPVRVVRGDLADRDLLRDAFDGCDVVFHVAAKAGVWGDSREYERTNVVGTENVIAACQARKVRRLVYTSSPAAVFDGRGHVRASNDLPYPRRHLCHYARTKAVAERLVLGSNGRWGLATCALRPHLILGARDPHLAPRLIERARAGKLVRVGDGRNEVTLCAVENAVHAHLSAAKSLALGAPHAGCAYFIGQEEPVVLWDWIADLLARSGAPPVSRTLSLRSAYALGFACEAAWKLARRSSEPPLTRFVALQLGTSHSYDMEPARRDFGYREVVSTAAMTDAVVTALQPRG